MYIILSNYDVELILFVKNKKLPWQKKLKHFFCLKKQTAIKSINNPEISSSGTVYFTAIKDLRIGENIQSLLVLINLPLFFSLTRQSFFVSHRLNACKKLL